MGNIKKFILFAGTLALLAFPFLIWLNAQALSDWWQLRNYTPPSQVSSLASEDALTSYGKHVFYVNHPDIESSVSTFRNDCATAEQTIVLGCYHPDQRGIFIYNVTDSRLDGIKQVTAAHEMLHAAYDRLSSKDRSSIDKLLNDYYTNDLKDQRIIDTINLYRQTEPNDVVNEMHSIFGTEVTGLPQPLENYYKKYFINRAQIVTYANSYEAEYDSRKAQIASDDQQLTTLKQSIDAQEASLTDQSNKINEDRANLDSLRASNQISSYNAGVESFNQEVRSYNAGVAKLQDSIAGYNALVVQRNSVASDLASLEASIDTRLKTQTSQ